MQSNSAAAASDSLENAVYENKLHDHDIHWVESVLSPVF